MARGIYKRGNIYWIRYSGLDGMMTRESSKSSRFKDAETLLIMRKQEIKEGKQPEIKRIENHSFNELVDVYLQWAHRQKSFKSKQRCIKQLVQSFGKFPIRRFTTMLVEQFQTERLQRGNKPATVNRLLATLKHMFTKAVEWDMVEEEVLKRMRRVKLLPENNRRLRYLSKEECRELIEACDEHVRPIVITALNTGMRKGEILNLRWDQVDLKHGFILLDVTKNGDRREIPINDTLKTILQGLMRRIDVPYVFYESNAGKPYQDVKRSFITALRRCRIDDFRFHDLRHTFASHLIMAGVDLTTVKELLGHKTVTMTLRYAHLAPHHKAEAVNLLNQRLIGISTAQKEHNQQKVGVISR